MGSEFGDQQPRILSRRELLRSPFKHFGKNEDPENPKTQPSNRLVEGIGEAISVLGILSVAWRGSQDQLVSYEVDAESRIQDLPRFPEIAASFESFNQAVAPIHEQLARLERVWRKSYEHTVCVPVTTYEMDNKGNLTSKTTIECSTDWDEPVQLTSRGLNYNRINDWEKSLGNLGNRIKEVQSQSPQAFDLSHGGSSLFYQEKAADTGGQVALAGIAYGLIGTLFCLYEEGASSLTEDGSGNRFIDDRKYIKRRTLFKLAAVGLMSLKMRDFQRAFVGGNTQLLDQIKTNTHQVLAQTDIAPEENFRRFFGTDPRRIRNTVVDIRDKTDLALSSGYLGFLDSDWDGVRLELERTNAQAISAVNSFDDYFSFEEGTQSYEIPAALTTATKNIWGTREVVKFASSQSSHIYTRHLTDALSMALGLGTLALIGEKLLFPFSDKARDALKI